MIRPYKHVVAQAGISLTLALVMTLGLGVSIASAGTKQIKDMVSEPVINPAINVTQQVELDSKSAENITSTKINATLDTMPSIPLERFAPVVYKDTVAWVERIGADYEICVAEVYGSEVKYAYQATQDNFDQAYPSIYGDRIVWDDDSTGKRSIVVFKHSANPVERQTKVFASAYNDTDPNIFENLIVFQRKMADGGHEIMLYELDSSNNIAKTTQITSNRADDTLPVIYGNTIVWQRKNAGTGWDLYKYEIGKSQVNGEPLYVGNGDQVFPSVGGYKENGSDKLMVVWEDWRDEDKSQVYFNVLGTNTIAAVAPSKAMQIDPITSGGAIVWAEQGNKGKWMIKIFDAQKPKNPSGKPVVEVISQDSALDHYFPALHLGRVVWTTEEKLGQENVYFKLYNQIVSQ